MGHDIYKAFGPSPGHTGPTEGTSVRALNGIQPLDSVRPSSPAFVTPD